MNKDRPVRHHINYILVFRSWSTFTESAHVPIVTLSVKTGVGPIIAQLTVTV